MRPSILCFAGLDPCGGAGLQADIESISQCGGYSLPIATCLTVQNTQQVRSVSAVKAELIQQQVSALIQDIDIAACKISVIPNQDIAHMIAEIIADFSSIPVIYDPVLIPSQGQAFSDPATLETIQQKLLPKVDIITPNHNELDQLAQSVESLSDKISAVTNLGPNHILVTGADEDSTKDSSHVNNHLYTQETLIKTYAWPRLPHTYHGSGCTMSSALACFLALGESTQEAALHAQQFTYNALQHAEAPGRGQMSPARYKAHT